MPKFYHKKHQCGYNYKARAIGWRRIPLFCFLPYLTSEDIYIHIDIKKLFLETQWEQGTLRIEPPVFDRKDTSFELPGTIFDIDKSPEPPELNKWWSQTLPIHTDHGYSFFYPRHIHCTIDFQNFDNKEETCTIPVANIYVMGRSSFFMWTAPIITAAIGIIIGIIKWVCS